ncbi:MAG: hypothetical protein H6765_00480 [Candidatus Peribacteria bacterium]|nr:MAG: hypothetical protein H6765_00480 [Candidatus Peribacteria bacterium]
MTEKLEMTGRLTEKLETTVFLREPKDLLIKDVRMDELMGEKKRKNLEP